MTNSHFISKQAIFVVYTFFYVYNFCMLYSDVYTCIGYHK